MRLAFVGTAESIHTAKWVNFFAEDSAFSVSLYTLGTVRQNFHSSVEIYDYSSDSLPIAAAKCRKALRTWVPDVVHCHSIGTYGLLALFGIAHNHKLVVTPWGSEIIFGSKHFVKRPVLKRVLSRATLVTADAVSILDLACSLGASRANCHQINFGIDTDRFTARSVDTTVLAKYKIPNDGTRIISTRNFDPVYDIETLLKAFQIVLRSSPSARLVLLGSGPLEASLKNLANELGISESTHFVGRIPNEDLPGLLTSQDLYVSTSKSDAGIASSTAEAMSCELPVLISDSAENPLWVSDSENGFLFATGNVDELAEKLLYVIKELPNLSGLCSQARATIIERNDHRNEMNKMAALYKSLLD